MSDLYGTSLPHGNKVYIFSPCHLTKMAAMSIYGINLLKIFSSRTISQMTLKLGTQQKNMSPTKVVLLMTLVDLDLFYNSQPFHWNSPSTFSNMFSETTEPTDSRFYMEHLCFVGTKVYRIGPDHITKMAAMPIYIKNPLKTSSPEP